MSKFPRVVIAAPQSGSGKTLLTCAMLEYFKSKGNRVMAYKCGPDYIDTMFHKKVIGIPSENLDLFFQGEQRMKDFFEERFCEAQAQIAVVEGVMGLYDGLGGVSSKASSYHVAECLNAPVILVVNARGMGRSLLALLAGFLKYDTEHLIKGVILNQTSKALFEQLKPGIEQELKIAALGFLPMDEKLHLESRHLGLKLPEEIASLQKTLTYAGEILEQCVDMEAVWKIAHGAAELAENERNGEQYGQNAAHMDASGDFPVLAVARDEVFCFYYEENLRMLEGAGLKLKYFSPLHDKELPEGACGILLGGGYPELKLAELGDNASMRQSIRSAIESGMPSVAECGGFMYLQESVCDEEGGFHNMAGVLPGRMIKQDGLVRFGYVEIEEKSSCFLPEGSRIRGHEFHYYDSDWNGASCVARKPLSKRAWDCVDVSANHWWGFPHLYYASCPEFVRHFAKQIKKYQHQRKCVV